jgi:1-acyl-sn-glycerol-3-phosphate acyltransferase
MTVVHRVASAIAWGLALLGLLFVILLMFVLRPFLDRADPDRRRLGRMFHGYGVTILRLQPFVRIRFDVRTTAPYGEPCVVVANHESDCDVYVSSWLATLGWNMKYLSKKSLFDLPIFGPAMRLVGDISVIRGDRRSRLEAFERCRWWLAKGMPVLFFPEGTRSRTGEMARFKDGAFRLAIEAGAPVRPVVFAGTRDALPPGEFFFRPARIGIRVLDPIPVAGLTVADAGALAERVQAMVLAERDEMRRTIAGPA